MKLAENNLRKLVREILRVKWRGEEFIVSGDVESQIEKFLQSDVHSKKGDVRRRSVMKGRRKKSDEEELESEEEDFEIASEIAELIVSKFQEELPDEFVEKNSTMFAKKMANLRDLVDSLPVQSLNSLVDAFFGVFNTGKTKQAFEELFSRPFPAATDGKANSVVPNKGVLGSKAFFDVRNEGTGDTMGKGEVMVALQYGNEGEPTFILQPGQDYDLQSKSAGFWHVKDLTASKNIALGKAEAIDDLSTYFPVKLFKDIPNMTPKKFGGDKYAEQWLDFLSRVVLAMESGDYTALGEELLQGTIPHAGDSIEDIIIKSQKALDAVIRNPEGPMGDAKGIIFFKDGKAYMTGVKNASYIRGNARATVIGISPTEYGHDVGKMTDVSSNPQLPVGLKAAIATGAGQALVKRINALQKTEEETGEEEESAPEAPVEPEVEIEAGEEEVISESAPNRWQLLAGIKDKVI